MMIMKIIEIVKPEASQIPFNFSHDILPLATASMNAPNAPTAPASLGVANPKRIDPLTMKINATGCVDFHG